MVKTAITEGPGPPSLTSRCSLWGGKTDRHRTGMVETEAIPKPNEGNLVSVPGHFFACTSQEPSGRPGGFEMSLGQQNGVEKGAWCGRRCGERLDILWTFEMLLGAQPTCWSPSCPGACPAGLLLFPPSILSFPFKSKTPHNSVWRRVGRKYFTCLMGRDFLGHWGQEAPRGPSRARRKCSCWLVISAVVAR